MQNRKQLKNGGDPRGLPDYAALRDEMLKLSHPARPDVNWQYAETLCWRLSASHGVDLQTAAWFTLARTHISGLAGMDEGLALISQLFLHHWPAMWPANLHARAEIVAGLNQRLQIVFRTLRINNRDALPLLYSCDQSLTALGDTLTRYDLKQAAPTVLLQHQIRQAISRLEDLPVCEQPAPPEPVTPIETVVPVKPEISQIVKPEIRELPPPDRQKVIKPHPVTKSASPPPSRRRALVWSFIAGAGFALLAGGLALWGWNMFTASSPAEQRFIASLKPLPDAPTKEQLAQLRQSAFVAAKQDALLAETAAQLKWLMSLPPDWPQRYGQSLIAQAGALWPDNPAAARMRQEWQQKLDANALPLTAMGGWHEGMTQLQQLSDRLNALDEQRGKYMTVSELKSQVFTITQAFSRTVPFEEQLRKLAAADYGSVTPVTLKQQSEQHLKELIIRSALIDEPVEKP
ncbi:VasL domain-containing protein [Pantoea sp. FN060301]|uniref:VasL domain-containing protein n=1 Tax=Pantoea sp. FN060301 TaxID=3420380 RepID=UPI003D17EF8F